MPIPSLARDFYDRVMAAPDRVAFLSALAGSATPVYEEEWLEFKRAFDIMGVDVKENWSKALSGFANTGGGVLIWGIKADKDPATGIDCASATSLIENPAALKTRLMQLHHQATDPPVLGVIVEQFSDPASGKGFVVCFVPESTFRPHRAEHVQGKPYYIRAGDDFTIAPSSVLKAMFYPRASPYLSVEIGVTTNDIGDGQFSVHYEARLQNVGTATANDVYVVTQIPTIFKQVSNGIDWEPSSNPQGSSLACRRPIHPGAASVLFNAYQWVKRGTQGFGASFGIVIYARDHQRQRVNFKFSDEDVLAHSFTTGEVA